MPDPKVLTHTKELNINQMDVPFKLPLLLDGATGTNLIAAGMPRGVCPEQWILENPKPLQDLQRSFIEAGSDAVLAPTFGAHRARLYHVEDYDPPICLEGRPARQVLYRYAGREAGPSRCQYEVLE